MRLGEALSGLFQSLQKAMNRRAVPLLALWSGDAASIQSGCDFTNGCDAFRSENFNRGLQAVRCFHRLLVIRFSQLRAILPQDHASCFGACERRLGAG